MRLEAGSHPCVDERGGSEEPVCRDALVFVIRNTEAVRSAVERFSLAQEATGALGAVLEYVTRYRHQGAELTPLYPERAVAVLWEPSLNISENIRWKIAVPDLRSPYHELSAYHYLRLASSEQETFVESLRIEAILNDDPGVFVYHPAAPYPRYSAPMVTLEPSDEDWGINRCNFPQVWECLDQSPGPGPIGVIDEGPYLHHPELDGRVTEIPIVSGPPADVLHASQVAAIIAARRDDGKGMRGCCSAHVNLYNVATTQGFDCKAFYLALKDVARCKLRIVNISMFTPFDPLVEKQIQECIDQDIIIVAAMGDGKNNKCVYPAAYHGVIAVGATDRDENKLMDSNTGDHILLSAPGQAIYTLVSDTQLGTLHNTGTSYATPMVSAAAWLALCKKPDLTLTAMRDLLAVSVFKRGLPYDQVGHGRLDMAKMVEALHRKGVPGMEQCRSSPLSTDSYGQAEDSLI